MRRYYAFILFLVSVLSFASCTNDDKDSDIVALNLNVSIDNRQRISKQAFTDGDRIGLYLVNYTNDNPGILGDVFATRYFNSEYILNGAGWYANDGKEIFMSNAYSDLYAYYPYDPEMSKTSDKMNLTAYPFRIQTEQSASSTQSDFLWAKTPKLSVLDPQAIIIFKHLMSRFEINLKFNNQSEIPSDPQLKIYNMQTFCTINLRTGITSPAGEVSVIKPYRTSNTTEGFDFTYDVIIVPQFIMGGTPLFSVTTDNSTLIYETENDITVTAQNIYTFNMTVGTAQTPEN
ncbi:MAG: fimbrillin family protein [Dysgonomonas sp.]|nr:fimbrillin family protein [Dysgonomonas sp.]